MRQKTLLLLLLCSTALIGQIPAPTVNTTLYGREGNNLIPISVAQILGLSTGLSTVAINSTLTGNGTAGSPLGLAQQGAQTANYMRWNGTSWLPATPQQMSQETGNWGRRYPFLSIPTMAAANNYEGWVYQRNFSTPCVDAPIPGVDGWFTMSTGIASDYTLGQYSMQIAYSMPENSPAYCYVRYNLNGFTAWEKLRAGIADNLLQMGATTGQALRWNGTTWAPGNFLGTATNTWFSSADSRPRIYFLDAGAANSPTLIRGDGGVQLRNSVDGTILHALENGGVNLPSYGGTGFRLALFDAGGTLVRGTADPANIFYQNNSYGAAAGMNLKWTGSTWNGSRENGNFGTKEIFGSFPTFEAAAAAGKEGACYVYNNGTTPVSDQPMPGGVHGYYCITIGIGSDIATTAHCMQIAYGQPVTVIADREWRRYRINGTWGSWIDVATPRQNGAILGDVLKWTGAAFTPEKDAAAYESTNSATYNVANNNVRHIIADAQFNNVDIRFNGDEPDGATWRIYCRGTTATRFVFVTVSSPLTTIRRANNFQTDSGVTSNFNTNILIEVTRIGNIIYMNTISN